MNLEKGSRARSFSNEIVLTSEMRNEKLNEMKIRKLKMYTDGGATSNFERSRFHQSLGARNTRKCDSKVLEVSSFAFRSFLGTLADRREGKRD